MEDFGFRPVDDVIWDVGQGGVPAIIVETGGTTSGARDFITVRYDTQSPTAAVEDTVEIRAQSTAGEIRTVIKRRTVFKVTWKAPNLTNPMDGDDQLQFPEDSGTDRKKAEFNWDGERGATRTSAKMEGTLQFAPTDIFWAARGVQFVFSQDGGGSKFQFRLHRLRIWQNLGQTIAGANRIIQTNDPDWVYDGDSDPDDAQYPSLLKPDKAFRMDTPAFNADSYIQKSFRLNLREIAEWHNGTRWWKISTNVNADWYATESSILPAGAKGGDNLSGAGAAGNVFNTRPVANAGPDQVVAGGAVVTLAGSGSDADNDTFTYEWTAPAGVTLSDPTSPAPTFTAPAGPAVLQFTLRVRDLTRDLHHHNPNTFESAPDTVSIDVQ